MRLLPLALVALLAAPAVAADPPTPRGRQELFDLSARRAKLRFELATLDKQIAALERAEFAGFDRVADPTGTDYWESVSDTVLFATARQDVRKGELLLYHAPGIYRVKDARPKLTTYGECWYFRPDRDIKKADRDSMVCDTLDKFSIVGKKDLYPNQLSGGQQQLVAVARAVIAGPKVILADEPTGNLHSSQGREIMELFTRLNQAGTTIVQVTHSDVNAGFGSRVIELKDGWMTT